jgi:hypothetical protein
MLGRMVAATLLIGGAMTTSGAALAQQNPAAAVVEGVIVGTAVATGAIVPYEQREPLREYVVRENRPSYRYDDEVVVGRELRPGPYESYPVPERYAVPEHHYTIINNRVVVFHPKTRQVVHVYDPHDRGPPR